jgi:hypothetical protein
LKFRFLQLNVLEAFLHPLVVYKGERLALNSPPQCYAKLANYLCLSCFCLERWGLGYWLFIVRNPYGGKKCYWFYFYFLVSQLTTILTNTLKSIKHYNRTHSLGILSLINVLIRTCSDPSFSFFLSLGFFSYFFFSCLSLRPELSPRPSPAVAAAVPQPQSPRPRLSPLPPIPERSWRVRSPETPPEPDPGWAETPAGPRPARAPRPRLCQPPPAGTSSSPRPGQPWWVFKFVIYLFLLLFLFVFCYFY